jgi:hypothetical protein
MASPQIKLKKFKNQDSKDYDNTFYNDYEDNEPSGSSSSSSESDSKLSSGALEKKKK